MENEHIDPTKKQSSAASNIKEETESQTATLAPPPFQFAADPPPNKNNSSAMQLKKEEGENESVEPMVNFFWGELKTRGELLKVYKYHLLDLKELYNLTPPTANVSENYEYLVEYMIPDRIAEYNENQEGKLSKDDVDYYYNFLEKVINVEKELNKIVLTEKIARLQRNHSNLKSVATQFRVDDKTKEMYRIAFEKGDAEAYKKIGSIISEVEGTASKINSKINNLHKVLSKAGEYINLKDTTAMAATAGAISKDVSGAFGKVKSIYSDIDRAIKIISVLSGDHGSFENAVGGIEIMGEAAGEAYGRIPGMGWYGDYISSSVSQITKTMGKLNEAYSKQDRDLRNGADMENVKYLYHSSPGGISTFEFMQKVMRAKGPHDIKKADITSEVADFFEQKNESKINKALGNKKGNKMPVKHVTWGNDTIKKQEFKTWIFKNRKQIWYMLYGKTDIQAAIQE